MRTASTKRTVRRACRRREPGAGVPDGVAERVRVGSRRGDDLGGHDRAGQRIGPAVDPGDGDPGYRADQILDRQRVDLDPPDVDDVRVPAAEHDPVICDLHQIAGGAPGIGIDRRLSEVAQHPDRERTQLAVDHLEGDVGILAGVEQRQGQAAAFVSHRAQAAGFAGGVDLRDVRIGEGVPEIGQQMVGHRLAAERDLRQRGLGSAVAAQLGEQEAPERRRRAGPIDAVAAHRRQAFTGTPRARRHQRRLGGDDVDQDLEAGELLQPVRQQPAMLRGRLDVGRRAKHPHPIVAHAPRRPGGAGGQDQQRPGGPGSRGGAGRIGGAQFGGVDDLRPRREIVAPGHEQLMPEAAGELVALGRRGDRRVHARLGAGERRAGQQGEDDRRVLVNDAEALDPSFP